MVCSHIVVGNVSDLVYLNGEVVSFACIMNAYAAHILQPEV